jgi:hypothetical protein
MNTLRWGERKGRWRRIIRGVYGVGPDDPSELDEARARVLSAGTPARDHLAGVLHGLDAVELDDTPPTHRRPLPPDRVVVIDGVPCADALQTLVDLANTLDDDRWEQALESALRMKLVTVADLNGVSGRGSPRIRRVIARRPVGAPPTGSILETMMVQLARTIPGLGDPVRQLVVLNRHGDFVACVDLCWPALGIFIELDGMGHKGQPVYDARRQTAVTGATGWLCGRFTWREVVHLPSVTRRGLIEVVEQAKLRPAA